MFFFYNTNRKSEKILKIWHIVMFFLHKISYSYDIIDIRNISCEELLYHDNPSAVALSILCDFEGKDKQMVVNTILKRIKELTQNDDREYKNYLKKVTVLSTNRDLEENVKKGADMLSIDIEKIPFYQDGLKKGIQDGLKKGIQEGIEKGIEKGKHETLKLSVKAFHSVGYDAKKIAELLHLEEDEVVKFLK
jgi:predicted transposase YdaD